MNFYVAISKKGKVNKQYGISDDPGKIFRNLSEDNALGLYDVAKYVVAADRPVSILPSRKSDYWNSDYEVTYEN